MWSVIRMLAVFWAWGGRPARANYYLVDVEDILSPNLMPANLLMVDGPEQYELGVAARSGDEDFEPDPIVDASVEYALTTMDYHRKKINEYFCNNFVAADLIGELMPQSVTSISQKMEMPRFLDQSAKMLFDEGSKSYKTWLERFDGMCW
jgi:hypothetical protein